MTKLMATIQPFVSDEVDHALNDTGEREEFAL